MKTISRYIMTLALLITAVGGAWAQTQWPSGDCTVTLSNGTLTVSGNGAMADYPNLGRPWENNSGDVTSVVVESGVTSVGMAAFYYFTNMTSVTLPEGLTSIGEGAFYSCSAMTSVTLPEGLTAIGAMAFASCSSLTSITIPSTVTSIGTSAFKSCSSLTSITIPSMVTSIGDYAFMKSSAISDVNLYANPDKLTWGDTSYDFKSGKATQCHVLAEHLSTYQTKFSSVNVTFVGDLKPLPSGIDVTTDAASEQDLFTEASFEMPASDVTVNYTLVRDMQDETNPVAFSGIPADGKITVKKGDNGKYQPAEALNIQLIDPLAATDAQNIIASTKDVTIKVLVGDDSNGPVEYDQENPITLEAFLADTQPGFYWIKAVATADGAYDGTVYSTEMWLTEGYDLTLNSPQVSSVTVTIGDAVVTPQEGGRIPGIEKDKSVKLSVSEGYMFSDMFTGYKVSFTPAGDALAWNKVGCYYWGDHGDNNIFNPVQWPGVQMTKNGTNWETIVNANGLTNIIFNDYQTNNQQTSDLPFASGAADDLGSYTIADAVEMTYNTAMTEATFSIPANDFALNFSVKRNLASNVTVDMLADRIRIKKEGDLYVPVDAFQLVPTVKDVINAQNPVILEPNKDYTIAFQKKDGEGWADIQTFSVGQFRMVVMGAGEYGGTNYSTEFQLFEGYEVELAAGEYATYYCADAVEVEGDDAELYTIANVTESEAQLSEAIKVAPKETPLLVYNKSEESKTFLLIPTVATADEVSVAKEFRGTLVEMEMPASSATVDYYVCTGSAFMWVRDAGKIAANRCWLQIGEQPAASRAKTRSIVGGGDTTNMDDVRWQMEDDSYFDLQGRKVAKPTRGGIYIHNGKKVIKH